MTGRARPLGMSARISFSPGGGRRVKRGTEPEGIALDRQRSETYVTNYADDTVS